jgi:hypothetical protein
MERIKTFDQFYDITILPWISRLRRQQMVADYSMMVIVLAGLAFVPLFAFSMLDDDIGSMFKIAFACCISLLVISCWLYIKNNDAFEDGFKTKVIGQVIQFLHPGLEYKSGTCINEADYKKSSLFRNNIYDYTGDDLIKGTYKNIYFQCSELRVAGATVNSTKALVFRGLFFAARLNISAYGNTYIWCNNNIQLPGSIADEHYRMMPLPPVSRVNCSDGKFEKFYSVFATDTQQAVELITPALMEAIMQFRTQINRDISLSFVEGVCYVAIPFDHSLFEVRSDNACSREDVKEYFFTVLLILSIINELQLYNR